MMYPTYNLYAAIFYLSSTPKSPPFLHLLLKFRSLSSKASKLLEPSYLSSLISITFPIMPYGCQPDPAAVLWIVLFCSRGCPGPRDLSTAPPTESRAPTKAQLKSLLHQEAIPGSRAQTLLTSEPRWLSTAPSPDCPEHSVPSSSSNTPQCHH